MKASGNYAVNAGVRRKLLARIHIGKKELGMDDGAYRALLNYATGKDSCKAMSQAQLYRVLTCLDELKGQQAKKEAQHKAAYLKKINEQLKAQGLPESYGNGIAKKAFHKASLKALELWELKKVIQMLAVYSKRHAP